MSTNKLLEALSAYQQLSDREQELFYQVVYREESQGSFDCCAESVEPDESNVKEVSSTGISDIYKEFLETIQKSRTNSIQNPDRKWDVKTWPNGTIIGYGLTPNGFTE